MSTPKHFEDPTGPYARHGAYTIRGQIYLRFTRSGMTQTDLSIKSGVARANICEYLRGKKDVNTETADRLMAALAAHEAAGVGCAHECNNHDSAASAS